MNNKTWVVVLNWNNGRDTVDCLQSILDSGTQDIEGVVVCDNDSHDGSVETIKNWAESNEMVLPEYNWEHDDFDLVSGDEATRVDSGLEFVLINTGSNLGFAGGNNVGIRYVQQKCKYDFIFLLNNDALVVENTVKMLVTRCVETGAGMCGCKVVYHFNPTRVQAWGGASFQPPLGRATHLGAGVDIDVQPSVENIERQLDYILGAALMISKPCLEDIGLMEESYFLYYEEVDWAVRARRAGFSLAYANDAVVFHKEGGTIGSSSIKGQRSLLSEYYLIKSRILFTRRQYPLYLPSVCLFTLAQLSRNLFRGDFKRCMVGLKAMFGISLETEI